MRQDTLQRLFTAIPTLQTERLVLRRIEPRDKEDMYAYSRSEETTRYLLWNPHPDADYTGQYIDYLEERYSLGDFYDWAVVLKEENRMIGTCGFTQIDTVNDTAEIGYVIHASFCGYGYATEAAREIIRFGFQRMRLARISALCMRENIASLRVMEKCGMHKEGLLRSAIAVKGRREDLILAALTRADFDAAQGK